MTTRDGDPNPTCAERFVETFSKQFSHRDILNEEIRVARCTVTALYVVCDVSSQLHVQPACVKHYTIRRETKSPRHLDEQSSK